MRVELSFQLPDGTSGEVSATAATYEEAYPAARAKLPDGAAAIVIRTDNYGPGN
ncbi:MULTISPECIES: hypothetical protein [Arthrobacter]|uniref:hypothetical protein n=1 Tax=Arthrobacter TaxID=1663 RepID=UPI0014053EBD|nr:MULTISPECIES: hypothetical protein [Arthrobacter]MBT8162602.1 hypothetical protein [Arthrobacter sp. GN70]